MKNLLLLLTFILFINGCDSPRSSRALRTNSQGQTDPFSSNSSTNGGSFTNSNNNQNGTSTNSSTIVIPDDAKHCKFATDGINGFDSDSTHLGPYTLCQSSTDKNTVYFQLKNSPVNANGNINICFIPTTNYNANSVYIGNPMCGTFTDPKVVRKITFVKYGQYSNANVSGSIFFKDLSFYYYGQNMMTLDAYKTCMYYSSYGNNSYCQTFKQVGQYVYKQF